jgi:hypothetical protein
VIRSLDVPRRPVTELDTAGRDAVHYPELATAIANEWRTNGAHTAPTDAQRDEAVLHIANETRYAEMIAAMDAVVQTKRALVRGQVPAFAVTLATQ